MTQGDPGEETRAERTVVGMALTKRADFDTCIEAGVAPSMFEDECLSAIYAGMLAAEARGQRPDTTTMTREMPQNTMLILSLSRSAPMTQNVMAYVTELMIGDWQRRVARELASLSEAVRNRKPFSDITGLKARAETLCREMQDVKQADGPQPMSRVLEIVISNIETRMVSKTSLGIPTGLKTLDLALSGGWQDGRLYFPAARPGKGKSTFAINSMDSASALGKWVAFFTVEMPMDQIGEKHVSLGSMVAGTKMLRGALSDDEGSRVIHAVTQLKDRPIWIDDSSRGDITEIVTRCRRLKRSGKLDVVFVDYLQLLRCSGRRWSNRVAELTEITGTLKLLALELKIPIICLSTINREAEKFDAPGIHHLKDCGSIEQDGDVVLLMHRDKDDITWMNVAKNRGGPEGAFKIDITPEISRVRDGQGLPPEHFSRYA